MLMVLIIQIDVCGLKTSFWRIPSLKPIYWCTLVQIWIALGAILVVCTLTRHIHEKLCIFVYNGLKFDGCTWFCWHMHQNIYYIKNAPTPEAFENFVFCFPLPASRLRSCSQVTLGRHKQQHTHRKDLRTVNKPQIE